MKTKKIISVFLLLAMLLSLGACETSSKKRKNSNNKDDESEESSNIHTSNDFSIGDLFGDKEENQETNGEVLWDGFSNEIIDFGGATINILGYVGEFQYDSCQIQAEQKSGDPVTDALYLSNTTISSQCGINIVRISPEDNDDMINKFRNSVSTSSNDYQALVAPIYYCASFVTQGLIHDIKGLNNRYLHLDKSWWDQGLMNDITINDRVYFITGDALVSDDEASCGLFFNKDMIADNGDITAYIYDQTSGGSIYDLVKSGKWTLDKMYDMIQMVVNPTTDYAFDDTTDNVWGMVGQGYDFMLFMQGFEQNITDKGTDANGREVPVIRAASTENYEAFLNLCNVFYNEGHVAVTDHYAAPLAEKRDVFAAGKALFMPEQIAYVGEDILKNSNVNYGILPMPKLDASQNDYATPVQVYHCAVISIPTSCTGAELDTTCYALEAMAFLGQKLVRSEYYERTLQRKNKTDIESAEMLDLIFQRKTYDMAAVYNFNAGDAGRGSLYLYTTLLYTRGNTNLRSTVDKLGGIYQFGIDMFVNKCYS